MEAEERTSDLEDRMVEISATEQNKGKKKWEQSQHRNSKDLTEVKEIKKRWQDYSEELYKKRS